MSEQRIIEATGEPKLRVPELVRDTHADALNPVTEVEQMFAAVRQELAEPAVALRSDLEELRRLVNDPPPTGETSRSTTSSDGTRHNVAPAMAPPRARRRCRIPPRHRHARGC